MPILLIAATSTEILPIIQELKNKNNYLYKHQIEVLITAVGQATTTYLLCKKLQTKAFDLVIQAGIAGTFTDAIKLGETVLVKQDCFADLGIEEDGNFNTIFDAGFSAKNEFPFTDGWLLNNHPLLNTGFLPVVKAVTVNKVSDRKIQKQQLLHKFSAQIESMEGAALHYVCLQEKIPFIQIRNISNEVGDRDKNNWKIIEAINNLNEALQKMLQQL